MKKITYFFVIICTNISIAQCLNKIYNGSYHMAAKKTDNTFWVWGGGLSGQLGNSTDFDEWSPIEVSTGSPISLINCGQSSTFVINQNGTLWGTGTNYMGALGVGSNILYSSVFLQIGVAADWQAVAPSSQHTIALKNNNTLWAWGHNNWYQLGNNTTTNSNVPIQISTDTNWSKIIVGKSSFSYALKTNNTLWCWGLNVADVLNSNVSNIVAIPTQHNSDSDWATVACGQSHVLAIKTNGTLWGWGNYGFGETGRPLSNPNLPGIPRQIGTDNDWVQVAAGHNYSMGIKTNGTLWSWGRNDFNQLGDGGTANRHIPQQIGTATNWTSVACGARTTVALQSDGSYWAWGDNIYGQIGNGTTDNLLLPTQIAVAGCTLGNKNFEFSNQINVSPNPSNNIFKIDLKANYQTIEIFDLLGKSVYNQNIDNQLQVKIDLTGFSSGCYVAKLVGENGSANVKLLKE